MFLFLCSFVFLGCPLPPEEPTNKRPQNRGQQGVVNGQQGQGSGFRNQGGGAQGGSAQGGAQGANQAGGNQGSGNQGSGQGGGNRFAGVPPSGGPVGGVLLDMKQMSAQKQQKSIKKNDHVSVSGVVKGDCGGDIRVDVIETSKLGSPQQDGGNNGPLTSLQMTKSGSFTILVPKNASISLTAICDEDKDQKITEKVDKLSQGARIGEVKKDISGVQLTLEEIKPPSAENAPGAGGPGAGGPGAGGQKAGGQNAGGAQGGGQNAAGAGGQKLGGSPAVGGQKAGGQNAGGAQGGGQNAAGAGGQKPGGQNAVQQQSNGQNTSEKEAAPNKKQKNK